MSAFAGAGALARLVLRRDRVRLPVWVLGILALVGASAQAVQGLYDTPAALAAYARTAGSSPAAVAMSGPPTALRTTGGVTVFEVNTSAILAVTLMALFLVVRHTRAEEEAGRSELLRAGVLGRHAQLAAALLVVGGACLLVGGGIAAVFTALGLPAAGSGVYGASIGVLGLLFTAIAAVASQLTEHPRGALALGGSALGASFLLRAVGDVGDGVLSWFSPIGWAQAVHAFAENAWWPLGLCVIGYVVLVGVAVALDRRRDFGAGLLPARTGPPHASGLLASPLGLMARQQRGALLGWSAGLFLTGASFGSLGREMTELVRSTPGLAEMFGGTGADLVDTFFGTATQVMALLAGGFTLGSVLRLRGEETTGRAEVVLATGVSRRGWALQALAVTAGGTLVVLAAGGLGAGLAHAIATGDPGQLSRLLAAVLAYAPAVLALGSVAVLLLGWLPGATPVAWVYFAGCFVLGWLGTVLAFPAWLSNLSPYTHVPLVPAEPMTWSPVLWLVVVAVGLVTVGVTKLSNRDIG